MNRTIAKTCPYYQRPFQASRKNKVYCSEECRVDANNAVAKGRYAHFKQGATQLEARRLAILKRTFYWPLPPAT